jgi:N-acetylglucosamine-6-phosphate deacetylase
MRAASMIDELIGAGLRIAAGHSDATAAEIGQAVDRGVSGVTHLFNTMSQLNAREPGWWVPRLRTTGCSQGSSATASTLSAPVCVLPSAARGATD